MISFYWVLEYILDLFLIILLNKTQSLLLICISKAFLDLTWACFIQTNLILVLEWVYWGELLSIDWIWYEISHLCFKFLCDLNFIFLVVINFTSLYLLRSLFISMSNLLCQLDRESIKAYLTLKVFYLKAVDYRLLQILENILTVNYYYGLFIKYNLIVGFLICTL